VRACVRACVHVCSWKSLRRFDGMNDLVEHFLFFNLKHFF